MAFGITQVNPVDGTVLTLRDTLQVRGFKIVKTGNFTAGLTGTARKVGDEFGTTGALADFSGPAFVFFGDAHALDIDIVAVRADKALGGTGVLTDSGTTALVTVTTITDLFGITNS